MPARVFQVRNDEKDKKLKPEFKLWLCFDGEKGGFGIGKWRLLDAIEKHGSLSSAVRILGVSYRKAWSDLEKSEKFWGFKLIEKYRGGASGGETRLTSRGKILVETFGKFYEDSLKKINQAFEMHILNDLLKR